MALHQVRMTSPEPRDSPERLSSPGDSNSNGENGDSEQLEITNAKERKTSGGFFAKRFGITKMKDHTTKKDRLIDTNSANNSPMEFKPLKVCKLSKHDSNVSTYSQDLLPQVPAVFRLLRPEFREQLKQSSCKVKIWKQSNHVLRIACVSSSKTVATDDEDKVACIHFKQLKYARGNARPIPTDATDKVTFLAIFHKLTQSLLHRLRSPMRILPKRGSFQFVERARQSLSGSSRSALSPKTE